MTSHLDNVELRTI